MDCRVLGWNSLDTYGFNVDYKVYDIICSQNYIVYMTWVVMWQGCLKMGWLLGTGQV